MEVEEKSKYWERIKTNIKILYKKKEIIKKYSYEEFCNDFIPDKDPLNIGKKKKCICDHDIIHNYKYKHKENEDYFILGSCCIKKFSLEYKKLRECTECGEAIKKNDDNLCKYCRKSKKEEEKYKEACKCQKCGYQKKDDKYKLCYQCKYGGKSKYEDKIYYDCQRCGQQKKPPNKYKVCYKCKIDRDWFIEVGLGNL